MKFALGGFIPVILVLFYSISIVSAETGETLKDEKNTAGLTNQSYDVRVALDHIFISQKNNSLEVSEIVVFRNEGGEIYYTKDNHTFFAISTPPDAKNLKTLAMECCLVQEEGTVYMDPMQPIKPGDNFEMQISYTLLPQSSEYVFNKSAVYDTTSLLMFIDKKSGVTVEGPYEVLTLSGNEYKVFASNNLKAGETVSIPVKILEESNYLYAEIGVFSLFLIGLVYRFRRKIFRRKKEFTLEELESEKRKILKTIYGFEKHAGPEKSEEYRKMIGEYRQKAIRILVRIDKLKNQGQSELLENGMK